ncbi:zinc metallochaperone AztD [Saccharomonospora cyanea]|uniref:Secreted protein n=1 Tax=Saccharomonospora cyanea NA-134 TaxID=882082 RepID=H5XJZ0_9PSEU|nr:zinc metallochaperone AztD [Saccharomonospora cyanea]EHR61894.1 hypothetical protein SaccyDRAFT_3055 [Saccharomonospora cyanea NA-134]
MTTPSGRRHVAATLTAVATVALSGACAAGDPGTTRAEPLITDPVVVTYDGGVSVLDGRTLEPRAEVPLPGFLRVNPAGDDSHVLVSTSEGFRVLDASRGELTDVVFPGPEPGHVVRHAGRTVLFADGSGTVTSFDPADLGEGKSATETYRTAEPHHGVAVAVEDGGLLVTLGDEEERRGIAVLDAQRKELTRNEDCPGVHGEATAQGGAVVVGCEDGVLVYAGGEITKVDSPTEYGRIGNQAGSDVSPIVLGDYKQDPDAELERPERISLIDTRDTSLELVDLGTSYTFRSLGRGPRGEALVLGTDGRLHVIDPESAEVTKTIPVLEPWEEPLEWQQPRPALFVRGDDAYVTDPATKRVHRLNLATGEKEATTTLPHVPNELSGVAG